MTTSRLGRRLRALFNRSAVEGELDAEVRLHLEMEIDDLMRTRGLSRAQAVRQARLRFGGVDRHTEAHRDARGVRWVEDGIGDLRYAVRALGRTPAFTVSTVLVLALGIGASTAIFSAVQTVIVSRLPYPDDERLVRIYNQNSPTNRWGLSVADIQAIGAQQETMTGIGAMSLRQVPVSVAGGEAIQTVTTPVSAGMFSVLGIRAAVGRVIERSDEPEGAPPVVVLSDAFATTSFGSPAAALNKTVQIDGAPRTVVGVLPPDANYFAGFRSDVIPSYQPKTPTRRGPFGLVVVGRLRDGVSLAAAGADLAGISKRIFPIWQAGFKDTVARYDPILLRTVIVGTAPKTLWMFAAAAALLLLTAVTNVASLALARMTSRGRELTVRVVLGASRTRLVRLVVAETLLLSTVGVLCGVAAAWGLLRMLIVIAPRMPRLSGATIDGPTLAFAVGVGLLAGLIIGIYPAWSLMGKDSAAGLQGGNREVGQGRRASTLRAALVAVEFALALPLLAGAGQLVDSITRLQRVDPGFDPTNLGYLSLGLPAGRYGDVVTSMDYWQRAMNAAAGVPGVVTVGFSTELPPDQVSGTNDFLLAGRPLVPGGASPSSPWLTASSSYFNAIGARLIDGRMFGPADSGITNALVVSESWARRYSPDQPAVGRRVFEGGCDERCTPTYIIGIVSDVKYQGLSAGGEAAYTPSTEGMPRRGYLILRTSRDPALVLPRVRDAIRVLDPGVPIDAMASMDEHVYGSTAQPRHWALLLAGFALAAVLLAAIGTFGLLSYIVSTMRREIGVRVALGANGGAIARMVMMRGLTQSLIGAAAGLVIAVAGRRLLEASLFEVSPGDPFSLAVVTVVLVAVALVASWIPARRAAMVEPMEALRVD